MVTLKELKQLIYQYTIIFRIKNSGDLVFEACGVRYKRLTKSHQTLNIKLRVFVIKQWLNSGCKSNAFLSFPQFIKKIILCIMRLCILIWKTKHVCNSVEIYKVCSDFSHLAFKVLYSPIRRSCIERTYIDNEISLMCIKI